jgi:hypothetical protein
MNRWYINVSLSTDKQQNTRQNEDQPVGKYFTGVKSTITRTTIKNKQNNTKNDCPSIMKIATSAMKIQLSDGEIY